MINHLPILIYCEKNALYSLNVLSGKTEILGIELKGLGLAILAELEGSLAYNNSWQSLAFFFRDTLYFYKVELKKNMKICLKF